MVDGLNIMLVFLTKRNITKNGICLCFCLTNLKTTRVKQQYFSSSTSIKCLIVEMVFDLLYIFKIVHIRHPLSPLLLNWLVFPSESISIFDNKIKLFWKCCVYRVHRWSGNAGCIQIKLLHSLESRNVISVSLHIVSDI